MKEIAEEKQQIHTERYKLLQMNEMKL